MVKKWLKEILTHLIAPIVLLVFILLPKKILGFRIIYTHECKNEKQKNKLFKIIKVLSFKFRWVSIQTILQNKPKNGSICFVTDDGFKDNLLISEVCQFSSIPFGIFLIGSSFTNKDQLDEQLGRNKEFLSKQDIFQLKKQNIFLGVHCYGHNRYSHLTRDELKQELDLIEAFSKEFSVSCDFVPFPYGRLTDLNWGDLDLLDSKVILTAMRGVNRPKNIKQRIYFRDNIDLDQSVISNLVVFSLMYFRNGFNIDRAITG